MVKDYLVRALEIHSQLAWDFDWVVMALDFAQRYEMNTLILHRNDFIDRIVYPGTEFGCQRGTYRNIFDRYREIYRTLYRLTPTRRSGPFQRRAFLQRVIHEAAARNIEVFVQNKELNFPGIILELHPELVKDGHVCPNEPFWWQFLEDKYSEFFAEFPGIAGVITAPATGESKVSIASNRCECERCKDSTPQDWYRNVVLGIYGPAKRAGKRLLIRDFVFDAAAHAEIVSALNQMPADIGIALKNTPHDYYPTFPDNPRIGTVGDRPQWVEFDSMGQYFGWGIGIASMIDDYRRRLRRALELGASGIVVRTDWESLDGHSSFQTPNLVNVIACASLGVNLNTPDESIYRSWATELKLFEPELCDSGADDTVRWIQEVMGQTWDIVKRTVFVNDCVFSDSSTIPVSMDHALWLAEEKNSLKDWDKSKATALEVSHRNVRAILEEKDEANRRADRLLDLVYRGNHRLSQSGAKYLQDRFDIMSKYVQTFRIVTRVIILAKYILETNDPHDSSDFIEFAGLFALGMRDLKALSDQLREFGARTTFAHTVYTLLDPDRLDILYEDLRSRTDETLPQ